MPPFSRETCKGALGCRNFLAGWKPGCATYLYYCAFKEHSIALRAIAGPEDRTLKSFGRPRVFGDAVKWFCENLLTFRATKASLLDEEAHAYPSDWLVLDSDCPVVVNRKRRGSALGADLILRAFLAEKMSFEIGDLLDVDKVQFRQCYEL
jgi:hypothetical protein